MTFLRNFLPIGLAAACAATPLLAQGTPDVQGYWAGGYTDGQGGEIQFELTLIDGIGELKYNTSNWGALGYAICEYVFALENGQPTKITRNSGAGTGDCLAEPALTIARPSPEVLALTFANPEVALDVVELGGILRPFDSAEAHAPVAGLDILGIAPGMTQEAIDAALSDKDYARVESRDRVLEYDGFTIDQLAWGTKPGEDGEPTDLVFVTFTARKSWAPDDVPVATNVGRDWSIPESEALAEATLVDTLAKKYGPRSNDINQDRLFDRAGVLMTDSYDCPAGVHQPVPSTWQMDGEIGEETVGVACGPQLKAMVVGDSSTGRAIVMKLRLVDPDPLWADFWQTWSHTEAVRLKTVYDGVTGATGAAPEL